MKNEKFIPIKLVFDFDYTLFSTNLFKDNLIYNLSQLGISPDIFWTTYRQSKKNSKYLGFNYQAKLIKKVAPQLSLKDLTSIFKGVLNQSPSFVYPETLKVLSRLSTKYHLNLISFGETKLQKEKIKKSKLDTFFQEIIISSHLEKTKSFKKIFEVKKKTFYIEDNPLAIREIKKTFPSVITIRIKRQHGTYTHKNNNQFVDYSINNLLELESIIQKHPIYLSHKKI
ncbi:MAG TPA: HAD family hydrolase [Candidatus Portnoybacteria bacterium]|nr:HAD family hydrolase [Candidatus Portnoybacteria bacterium]